MFPEIICLYIYSYLVGAIPTSYVIVRLVKGIDLLQYGSGNVGGSNVAFQLGKRWVAPVALLEFSLKGAAPALIGLYLLGLERTSLLFLVAPLLAVIGNNWSVFLRFRGGRGIMVICGMLTILTPLLLTVAFLIFLAGWRVTRSSGVWVLVAVTSLPLLALIPGGVMTLGWTSIWAQATGAELAANPAGEAFVISWYCTVLVVLVVFKRLLSNSTSFPEDLARRRVLFNRLFRDRDVDSRADWVGRIPGNP